jgi:hypothetical protein
VAPGAALLQIAIAAPAILVPAATIAPRARTGDRVSSAAVDRSSEFGARVRNNEKLITMAVVFCPALLGVGNAQKAIR